MKNNMKIILFLLMMIILTTAVGCNDDRTSDGSLRIESGGNYGEFNNSLNDSVYTFLVTNEKGEVLEGASVDLNGEIKKTGREGHVSFARPKNISYSVLTVSCDQYSTNKYEGYIFKEKAVDTIVLKSKSLEAHRLNKALYKSSTQTLDLLDKNKKIYKNSKAAFDISVEVINNPELVREYSLCQKINKNGVIKENIISTSINGSFYGLTSGSFEAGNNIYVKVTTHTGLCSATSINLEVCNEPDYEEVKHISLFGDSFSFKVDESVPLFGGTTLSMETFSYPVYTKCVEDSDGNRKVQIGINIDKDTFNNEKEMEEYYDILHKTSQYSAYTKSYKECIEKMTKYQEDHGVFGLSGFNKLGSPEVIFTGYVEAGFDSYGDLSVGNGNISLIIKQKLLDWDWACVLYTIPVTINVKGEIEADFAGAVCYSFEENKFTGSECVLDISPKINALAGIGFKGLSAGIYGSVDMNIKTVIASMDKKTGIDSIDLESSMGLYGQALVFKTEKQLLSGNVNLWSRTESDSKKDNKSGENDNSFKASSVYDVMSYEPIEEEYEVNMPSVANSDASDRVSKNIINDNASIGATPAMASNGSSVMAVYCSQKKYGNADNTYSKLYYSVYKDGVWQSNKIINDTACNEMNPEIVSDGNDYYIIYQNSAYDYSNYNNYMEKTDKEKNEIMSDFLKSVDLHVIKYNVSENKIEKIGVIQTNGEYDYGASLYVKNGKTYVYWISNDGDMFGNQESTVNKIMYAELNGSAKIKMIYETNSSISVLDAGELVGKNGVSCCFICDEDKELLSSRDRKGYLYYNGVIENVALGNVEKLLYSKYNKSFNYISDNTLKSYDGNESNVLIENISAYNNEFAITDTGIYYVKRDGEKTELFMSKNDGEGNWCNSVKMTSDAKWLREINAISTADEEIVLCLADMYEEELEVKSELVSYSINNITDICIEEAIFDENIKVLIKNNGLTDINSYEIKVIDADNNEIAVETQGVKQLKAGESVELRIIPTALENVKYGKWKVSCNITEENSNDIDIDNNQIEIIAGTSDFEVNSELHNSGAYPYVLIEVRNIGELTDSAKIIINDANDISKELVSESIENLESGAVQVYKIKMLDKWADSKNTVSAMISVVGSKYEYNMRNNYEYEYASMNNGSFNIQYVLNGGTNSNSNPSTYTTTSSLTFKKPSKKGYSFEGWYTTVGFDSNSLVNSIEPGTAGDIILYAKWKQNTTTNNKKNTSTTVSKTKKFREKKVSGVKLKNVKKKKVKVSWKKTKNARGYQIQYSKSKKFKKKITKNTKKTKITIKKLKKNKIYYFKVRAYKMNGKKKVYGRWSKVNKIKIKK